MKFVKETGRSNHDIWGDFECEHCGSIANGRAYDDGNYFTNVIPFVPCPACGLQRVQGEVKGYTLDIVEKKAIPEGYEPPDSYYAKHTKVEGLSISERTGNQMPWKF